MREKAATVVPTYTIAAYIDERVEKVIFIALKIIFIVLRQSETSIETVSQ